MSDLTPLEDALKIVLDTVPVLGIEKINLLDALGRVLAEDIIADRDNPPWDNSAMDGFAVRYQDIKQDHAVTAPTKLPRPRRRKDHQPSPAPSMGKRPIAAQAARPGN